MGRVIVVGSVNVDLTTRVQRHPMPGETLLGEGLVRSAGGKGANQAVSAARSGADVVMIGAIGDDEAGAAYRARLDELGVDTSALRQESATATGHALIAVSQAGENTILVIPGANASVTAASVVQQLDAVAIGAGDVLLSVLEVPLETVEAAARHAHDRGARVVLNLAPYQRISAGALALADPVICNEHEAAQLAEDGLPVASLLTTLGPDGAVWGEIRVPGERVSRVVDTTGAGDAFCGAFAAALAAGRPAADAVAAGVRAGGEAVTWDGAQQAGTL